MVRSALMLVLGLGNAALLSASALNCTCPPNATTGAPVARKPCGNAGHGTQNSFCPSNPAPHQCNPGGCNPPPPIVPEFEKLECKLHQLAFEFGTKKVPTNPQALHDALMLGGSCAKHADAEANARSRGRSATARRAAGRFRGQHPVCRDHWLGHHRHWYRVRSVRYAARGGCGGPQEPRPCWRRNHDRARASRQVLLQRDARAGRSR
jgi:hypothetical protein